MQEPDIYCSYCKRHHSANYHGNPRDEDDGGHHHHGVPSEEMIQYETTKALCRKFMSMEPEHTYSMTAAYKDVNYSVKYKFTKVLNSEDLQYYYSVVLGYSGCSSSNPFKTANWLIERLYKIRDSKLAHNSSTGELKSPLR